MCRWRFKLELQGLDAEADDCIVIESAIGAWEGGWNACVCACVPLHVCCPNR